LYRVRDRGQVSTFCVRISRVSFGLGDKDKVERASELVVQK
jgi:hypothetical protein